MKAQFINENTEFKRGIGSKKALSVGQRYRIKKGDEVTWEFTNFNGIYEFSDTNEGKVVYLTGKGPEVGYYHKGQGRIKTEIIGFDEIISINGHSLKESVDFKRGQSSIDALGVGSFAIKVVKELKKLEAYDDSKITISQDGDEIFIIEENTPFSIDLKGQTISTQTTAKQYINLIDHNAISFSATVNYIGRDDAEEEEWTLDDNPNPEKIAEEAEINYQNAAWGFEEKMIMDHIVDESVDFRRGIDSKDALELGISLPKNGKRKEIYGFTVEHFEDDDNYIIYDYFREHGETTGGNFVSNDKKKVQRALTDFDEGRPVIKGEPGEEDIFVSESQYFKRTGDTKNTLGIGQKWRILLHEDSYPYAEEEFFGSIEDAQKFAAKKLVSGWDYATYREGKKESLWATFSKWKDKYRNNGKYYKDSQGKYQQGDDWEGGWDEIFDYRIRLGDIDVTELRFNDKLIINDSKDRD